jgi:hypothetical protein
MNGQASIQTSIFIRKLPLEMRRMIYRLLLVSPELGDIAAIDRSTAFGALTKYGLAPEFLRTCRTIYDEAFPILYRDNTFALVCLKPTRRASMVYPDFPTFHSPFSRFTFARNYGITDVPCYGDNLRNVSTIDQHPDDEVTSQVGRVRSWRIFTSVFEDLVCQIGAHRQLQAFCRVIFRETPLKSLDIRLLCHDCVEYWCSGHLNNHSPRRTPIFRPVPLFITLKPFELLRNIDSLSIPAVTSSTYPKKKILYCGKQRKEPVDSDKYLDQLRSLIRGSTPVDFVQDMYHVLLHYTQTFERHEQYRIYMEGPPRNGANEGSNKSLPNILAGAFNPFQQDGEIHPLEHELKKILFNSDYNEVAEFKLNRKVILDYLEPQFQRISHAHKALVHEVKLLTPQLFPGENMLKFMGDKISLLESFAITFRRDMPDVVSRNFRIYQQVKQFFSPQNAILLRDRYMEDLKSAFRRQSYTQFRKAFKLAASDMDAQYLEIRQARQELFKYDREGTDRGCDIDIQELGLDERINWEEFVTGA